MRICIGLKMLEVSRSNLQGYLSFLEVCWCNFEVNLLHAINDLCTGNLSQISVLLQGAIQSALLNPECL